MFILSCNKIGQDLKLCLLMFQMQLKLVHAGKPVFHCWTPTDDLLLHCYLNTVVVDILYSSYSVSIQQDTVHVHCTSRCFSFFCRKERVFILRTKHIQNKKVSVHIHVPYRSHHEPMCCKKAKESLAFVNKLLTCMVYCTRISIIL